MCMRVRKLCLVFLGPVLPGDGDKLSRGPHRAALDSPGRHSTALSIDVGRFSVADTCHTSYSSIDISFPVLLPSYCVVHRTPQFRTYPANDNIVSCAQILPSLAAKDQRIKSSRDFTTESTCSFRNTALQCRSPWEILVLEFGRLFRECSLSTHLRKKRSAGKTWAYFFDDHSLLSISSKSNAMSTTITQEGAVCDISLC
jgi:hypothetical protein